MVAGDVYLLCLDGAVLPHIEQAPGCPLDPTDYYFQIGVVPNAFKVVIY